MNNMNKIEIESLFERWNSALQSGSAKKVTDLYDKDATFLPTMSAKSCRNPQEIEDYFIQFQANNPKGEINESNIRSLGNIAINSGIYTFTFKGNSKVQARYTFVYQWSGQDWKIIEHHSSLLPN